MKTYGSDERLILAARESLTAYACLMDNSFIPHEHLKLIGDALKEVKDGRITRLMIFSHPRSGKSWMVSRFFPAWVMGHDPKAKVICASNVKRLAEKFGSQVRDLIGNPKHQAIFGNQSALSPHTAAKGDFQTLSGGTLYAAGVGTAIIGEGAKYFIIDDPFADRQQVDSDVQRQAVKDWYSANAYSRLEKGGAIILMHQRWHDDDLAGWLLKEHSHEDWTVINLPAIADEDLIKDGFEDSASWRGDGEALCPAMFDLEALHRIKRAQHPRDWLAMYQQTPRSTHGGEFRRTDIQYYKETPASIGWKMNRYILVDPANSKKKNSDFTAMVVVGLNSDGNYYLLDAVYDRLNLNEKSDTLIKLHRKWSSKTSKPQVGYEQYGAQADIEHIKTIQAQENYRFAITPLGGKLAKNERIRRLVPGFRNQQWYLPDALLYTQNDGKMVDLTKVLIDTQLLAFPVMSHDDYIDALSRIFDMPTKFPSENDWKPQQIRSLAGI